MSSLGLIDKTSDRTISCNKTAPEIRRLINKKTTINGSTGLILSKAKIIHKHMLIKRRLHFR